jgi:cytoskeletal protein CcmA (bactofilin family)
MGLFGSKNSKATSNDQNERRTNPNTSQPSKAAATSREAVPTSGTRPVETGSSVPPSKHSTSQQSAESQSRSARRNGSTGESKGEKSMANIGQSIVFKGELSGDEDLEIDGQVEGSVKLTNNELTVGANGNLKADVTAKSVVVVGRVHGNLTATERIEIQATGIVDGDIRAPRLVIQEGAVLNGGIDMTKGTAASSPSAGGASASPKAGDDSEGVRQSA